MVIEITPQIQFWGVVFIILYFKFLKKSSIMLFLQIGNHYYFLGFFTLFNFLLTFKSCSFVKEIPTIETIPANR